MSPAFGRMEEDYLKTIWKATEWRDEPVTTTELAKTLGVSPSTVSGNLRKLSRDGLVDHTPYGRIELTERGRDIAIRMVRKHRLVESYLVHRLGFGWDEVHDEAEMLEHAVSERLLERIDIALDFPTHDPHGDPIPTLDGQAEYPEGAVPLDRIETGHHSQVVRVSDSDARVLQYLTERSIVPGAQISVQDHRDYADSLLLEVRHADAQTQCELTLGVARRVWVQPVGADS